MAAYGLLTVYNLELEIGISKQEATWTYAPLADGIDNLTEALNEVVQQYFFMSDQGFARIFGAKYSLDTARQSNLKLVDSGSGTTVTCDCTIGNIQEYSGASTDDSAISFEIRLDGKPTVTEST